MYTNKNQSSFKMLSRRLLRVKVMQLIYAHTQQGDLNYKSVENELFRSISKSLELYHFILLLPLALRRLALRRIENGKNKIRPSEKDLYPNTKFVNNKLLLELEKNQMLNDYVEETKLSWFGEDEDLLRSINTRFCGTDNYKEYMSTEESTFEEDSKFIIKFLNKDLPIFNFFFEGLENKSVYWNDEVEFAISIAIKTLKQFDGTNGADVKLMTLFKDSDDETFTKKLLRNTLDSSEETFELIKKYSKNWDAERIVNLDILLIQMAIAEMTTFKEIPIRVTLNEYIELSKYYSTEKSHIYINGMLEMIVRHLVEKNKISQAQLA